MATSLDKDLHDDMLKLVRYKILFVRREYEFAFPEHEDLISDDLTDYSFVAWKISEFIQDLEKGTTLVPVKWLAKGYPSDLRTGPFLRGIPHEDKKYLRLYYEVLDRYPRERFKYEEEQINILEQIRDNIRVPSAYGNLPNSPYDDLLTQLQLSFEPFREWRKKLRGCARGIGQGLSGLLTQYKDLGSFTTPSVSPEEIELALTTSSLGARETLNRFSGFGENILQVFIRKDRVPPSDSQVPANHSVRNPVIESPRPDVSYMQRVAESYSERIDPDDLTSVEKALAANHIDLHVHAYCDRLGLVSWSSLNQGPVVRMRGIGYPMDGKILFFKQMLNADLSPVIGPMPNAPVVDVVKDQFIVTLDFALEQSGKTSVCGCAMPVNMDFANCKTAFQGLVLKFRSDLASLSVPNLSDPIEGDAESS